MPEVYRATFYWDRLLGGPALFSHFPGASYSGFSPAPNVTLVGGATYAMVIGGVGGSINIPGDFFPGGSAITCFGTSCSGSPFVAGGDVAGFFATFGPAAATTAPEPGTWALLGVGLGAVGGVAGRRRRTSAA